MGVQLTRLRRLNQGTLTLECVRKNLSATVLQVTCTREFFLFLYRHKSERENVSIKQCNSSSTKILYLNILQYMDAAVDIGSNPVSKHQIQPECGE